MITIPLPPVYGLAIVISGRKSMIHSRKLVEEFWREFADFLDRLGSEQFVLLTIHLDDEISQPSVARHSIMGVIYLQAKICKTLCIGFLTEMILELLLGNLLQLRDLEP